MPEMNGRELSDRLMVLLPGIKRLYISGYTADIIGHHGVLEAGVPFLPKPFSKQELTAKIKEVLAG
jgi:CheY-like chemotaxis protein